MDTKTFIHQLCYKEKSNVPEADTKTPKKRKVEKGGERVPLPAKAMVHPRGSWAILIENAILQCKRTLSYTA